MAGSGTWIQKILKNGKFPLRNKSLLILLAGILLLVIAMPVSDKEIRQEEETETEPVAEDTYAEHAEEKLEAILSQMEGTGKVKVMVTLASSAEKIVEKDEESVNEEEQSTKRETTVYEDTASQGQTPYVAKELTPAVEGVVVICEGGEEPLVVQQITEAVEALFAVESHKIKVVKMK